LFHSRGYLDPCSLATQPEWTSPPGEAQCHPTGQAEFVICDYTIEEFFRDDKHHLHWEDGGPGTVQRQQRLCLALSCAYLVCAALGTQPEVAGAADRLFRDRSSGEKDKAPRYSRILLALRAIEFPGYFPPLVFERVFQVLVGACAGVG
jgi:hypothetical protein